MEKEMPGFVIGMRECQELLDVMVEAMDEDGICAMSQSKIAEKLGIQQGMVSHKMKQINAQDECIERVRPGVYRIHYTDLLKQGTFHIMMLFTIKLLKALDEGMTDEIFGEYTKKIWDELGATKKTRQIFNGYLSHELAGLYIELRNASNEFELNNLQSSPQEMG